VFAICVMLGLAELGSGQMGDNLSYAWAAVVLIFLTMNYSLRLRMIRA
jgi:hypothetical protein